jgi:polyhydroxyalkanoate synthesis regulator phasin
VNQPTFVPPGGGVKTRKLPPYPVSEGDSLASQINDLQDRIALLSNQLLYEKADVYTRLHRAVIRERRRRQATEKRVRELENLAQQLVHHYDDCFVQLAKEVASLRQEVARGNGTSGAGLSSSGNRFNLTREVDQLKEQVRDC